MKIKHCIQSRLKIFGGLREKHKLGAPKSHFICQPLIIPSRKIEIFSIWCPLKLFNLSFLDTLRMIGTPKNLPCLWGKTVLFLFLLQTENELQEVKSFGSIQMGFLMVDNWNVCIEPVHPGHDVKPFLSNDVTNSALWNSCFTGTEDFVALSEFMDEDITDSITNG